MPNRALGNAREDRIADTFDALGYFVISLRGSGSRGAKQRRREHTVCGDLLALGPPALPWLQIECGGSSKRIAKSFAELRAHALPGFRPVVVTFVDRKRRYYADEDTCVATPTELLEALSNL